MTVYGLLLGLQAIRLIAMRCDCERISGLVSWHTLMPGHNGLSARRLPIAFSCFSHLVIHGFGRRRFDLFAICQLALQSRVRGSLILFPVQVTTNPGS